MKNEIKIEDVSNGAVLSYNGYDDEGKPFKEKTVFEFNTGSEDSEGWEGLISLLWQVVELLGVCGSRYDEKRLHIGLVHGDKFICKDKKNCSICKEEE